VERQLGLFTAVDARRAGYEQSEIRRLCSAGIWRRVRRGVYMTAEQLTEITDDGRRHQLECLSVLLELSRTSAAISHESAARLWGVPMRRKLMAGPVRLSDPTLSRRARGYRVTQAPLERTDVVAKGPFRLTTASRTLVDVARQWDIEDSVVGLDAGLLTGLVTPHQLTEGVAAVQGWPGARRAVRALSLADGRAASPLETRGRLRIVGAGLPTPELQVEIRTGRRLVGIVDAWFEEPAVAVEFDGRIKYTDPWRDRSPEQVLWEEKRREDELRCLDIRVVRLVDADLGPARWPAAEARLRELLGTAGPAIRRFTSTPHPLGLPRTG
jgi:hypothetical protein